MLYFVFLPSLFAGLPLLAVLVGCAVLRSWMLHSGRSARGLNQMLASSAPAPAPPRHARSVSGAFSGAVSGACHLAGACAHKACCV